MNIQTISTKRLSLVAATHEIISAEIENFPFFSSLLHTQVGPEWPPGEYDKDAQRYFQTLLKENEEKYLGWLVWYVLEKTETPHSPALIGAAGYFGPPDGSGDVEIGFSLSPQARNKGYATEVVLALVKNGFHFSHVRRILARTSPENAAANRVLQKCGFQCFEVDEKNAIRKYQLPKPESLAGKRFINLKNGKTYLVLHQAIDCTNARDGTKVLVYVPENDPNLISVREETEFLLKFRKFE